ncbi:MAG: M20/M25/M40 family metallo-hydrolase, partial [Planctomycetes bacterium]|nr:M20/M25/M40 family metallo-hydrolase [Planctomycetota bacterium]
KTEDFENDIGYGKGSMVFHRIRRAVGDDAFFGALRDVVKEFTGRRASWDDLRQAFERRGGRQLKAHLDQYLDRTGAPVVLLEGAAAAADAEGWQVTGAILQRGEPWFLTLPLVVETAAGRETTTVDVSGERTPFSVRTRSLPLRVLLDPDSECWRGYAPGEAPAMLDATLQDPAGVVFTVSAGGKEPFLPVTEALRQRPGVREGTAGGAEGASSRLLLRVGDPGTLADLLPLGSPVKPVPGGVSVGGQSFRGEDVAVLASFRPAAGSPAAGARSCTLYWGASPAALSSARRVFFYGGDGVVVFRAGRPVLRLEPEGDESTRAALLEGLFPGVDAGRSLALVEALCAKEVEGRLAGSVEGAKAGKLLAGALVEDGHAVRVQEFSFEVPTWDGTPSCDGPEPGSRPMTFSARADEPVPVDPAGQILVGPETKAEELLARVREAVEKGAAAILVVGPPEVPKGIADYVFPLPAAGSGGPAPEAALVQAGAQARAPLPAERLAIPAAYYPKPPERSALPAGLRATVGVRKVDTRNLLAVIPGSDPALAGEAILLGAHHDHLGPGFPGANDDASGVAAVREAGRLLLSRRGLLRRPVVLAFFGAEEWGLRGSRAFAAARPDGVPAVAAALTLDTVGQAGVPEVNVVGESIYPSLARVMARCLAGAGLPKGPDIDRFAFAHGSDHYALHEAGIPAVDLFSAEYRLMHTPADTVAAVDGGKISRLARAAAAFAISLSRDGIPEKEGAPR